MADQAVKADGVDSASASAGTLSRAVQAVLLAGGRGTRMGRLTERCPKPLLPVAGRPLLRHQLCELAGGVASAVVVVGYRGEEIERAVGSWPAGQGFESVPERIVCVRQEEPLGTAHALSTALPCLMPDLPVLVLLGDLFVPWRSVEQMLRHEPPVVAVNRVEDPYLGAAVYWREGDASARIERMVEKPERGTSATCWNNTGVYMLSPSAVARCSELERSPRGEYELPDLIELLCRQGPVRAQPIDTPLHIGTPEDLAAAERWFTERRTSEQQVPEQLASEHQASDRPPSGDHASDQQASAQRPSTTEATQP